MAFSEVNFILDTQAYMRATSDAIISAHELEFRHSSHVILDQLTLAIQENERIGLIGKNGSGKTTLLKIIAGHQKPDAGTLSTKKNLIIGYLPQDFELNESENII